MPAAGRSTRRPVVNAALLAAELGIDSTNAHRYLAPLTEAAILIETTNRARNRIWRVLDIGCGTGLNVTPEQDRIGPT